jgi:hypothetical protein
MKRRPNQDINEPFEEYHVLNWTECARYERDDYQRPERADVSYFGDDWAKANKFIEYLEDLKRDPSYTVAIFGYEIMDEEIGVVHRVRSSWT